MSEPIREWHLARRPVGEPTLDHFELVEVPKPTPDTGEVLLKTLYQSVDPYMRGRMRDAASYTDPWSVGEVMQADVVAEVVESNADGYGPGDILAGGARWAEYTVADPQAFRRVDPSLGPISTAVGVLGMPGATAYFGVTDVAAPVPGDTFVVSAAAGAVGSVAGQLAARSGARVVGTAGSDEKCRWLTEELGFAGAINYDAVDDLGAALADSCPDGIDVFFDNVGGAVADAVWPLLNRGARVAVCGQIAFYNATEQPVGPRKLHALIRTRGRVQGFLVGDYGDRWDHAHQRLAAFIDSGELTYRENVIEGFEQAPSAFLGLFAGENIGKQLVHVADPG